MKFMAVDLGGTRLKMGVQNSRGNWVIEVCDSPQSIEEFIDLLGAFWTKHRPDSWSLAVPGPLTIDDAIWTESRARFEVCNVTRWDVARWVSARGMPAPVALLSDTTAMAAGLVGRSNGIVCQIATGVASRVVQQGLILRNPDDHSRLLSDGLAYEMWTATDGTTRQLREWTGTRGPRQWLPAPLKHMSLRELGQSDHPLVETMLAATCHWIVRVEHICPANMPIVLGGGGAMALGPRLLPLLEEQGLVDVRIANNAEKCSLQGIALLTTGVIALQPPF